MSAYRTITPNDPRNISIKLGQVFLRFDGPFKQVMIGEWDHPEIEYLSLEDLIKLRAYLSDKIMRIKAENLKDKPAPF